MPSRIQRRPKGPSVVLALLALLSPPAAAPAYAQFRDARVPEPGRLWFEIAPTLLNWSEQFAEDPSDPDLADGSREPLEAHFDGPLAARLFPGPGPFLADLNAGAAALGFDPVDAGDLSLGELDFSTIQAQVRRLAVGFEMGIVSRLSLGFRAPFTLTQVEPSFVFDSVAATVAFADLALPAGSAFFNEARGALTSLQELIDGGTLMGSELAEAIALREGADAFLTALEGRAMDGSLIPTASSAAGTQMDGRFSDFVSGFDAFGVALPALPLPATATAADLRRLFEEPPLMAFPPGPIENALDLGEVEISARFALLDQITRRPREPAEPDSVGDPAPAPGPGDAAPEEDDRSTVRLRTSVGATLRVPIRPASFPPFQNAAHFLDVPIGDGQTDIELALYQDVAVGSWLVLRTSARYGIQRPDEVILRVAPPDRPYAFASLQTVVNRDLGDYLALLIRPGLRLNETITLGLEYDYFRLGDASYTLDEPLPDVPDASPLELESSQTRHRIGIGLTYDLSDARDRDALVSGARPVGPPWRFGISIRRAVSGSGGRTPASFRYGAEFRVPIAIF